MKHVPAAERRDLWLALSLACATLIAYLPALPGTFVWDDAGHVTRPELQSLDGLRRIWLEPGATQQYYPLLHTAFWMEHRLWGDSVFGYHLLNVALHLAAAFLVVAILRRLAVPGAWLAGFLFALHPVAVEAVAWISEQKSTLSAFFYLSAVLAYLSFDATRRRSRYFLALALFVLALLSKTVTATLPAALLVVLWWRRGRLEWRRDLVPLLPWLALGAAAGLFTARVEQRYIGAQGASFALSFLDRCLLAGRAVWFYLWKLAWPANLIFTYPRWRVDPAAWWQYLFPLALLALGAALFALARRRRGPLAAFLFFTGTLFPALGFFNVYPFLYSYVADHFQYLASLGILALAASVIATRPFARYTSVALVLVLGALTFRQSRMYAGADTLYRETLARNPNDWMAYNNLGIAAVHDGRTPDAIADFEAALRIEPTLLEARINLGNALANYPHRLPEAIAALREATHVKPDSLDAHRYLADALAKSGRRDGAAAEYQAAIRLDPNDAELHTALGTIYAGMPGRLPEAIAEHQAALRIRPDFAEAHNNLGSALSQLPDRSAEAIAEYEAALRIRPDFAEAQYNLGVALAAIPGRLPEAIGHLDAALRLRPDWEQLRQALDRLRAAEAAGPRPAR